MYMRTVTEPRGTLPSVCAPAGLRRPCAHTSDSHIPTRRHLIAIPNKRSSIPLQTTPRRCVGTIDIVEPVFGGLGPATYRSAEAPVDRFQKRGEGYVQRVRITDPTPQAGVVHARDTWQHTIPLHGNSPSPLQPKTELLDVLLERAARARSCRRAAEHRSGVVILEYKTSRHTQMTLRSVPRRNYKRTTSTASMLSCKLLETNQEPPWRGASTEKPASVAAYHWHRTARRHRRCRRERSATRATADSGRPPYQGVHPVWGPRWYHRP